ncbi:MAG: PEP-CTERM sorting domain-containing protein [Phycisphaerae bacterium]
MKLVVSICICAILVLAGISSADLLIYEGFDYDAGALGGAGSAADDGWGGSWSVRSDDGRSVQVLSGGLTFGSLPVTGGSLRLQTNLTNGSDRYNRAARAVDPGGEVLGTVWHSHLLHVEPVKRTLDNRELVTSPIESMDSRWEARVDLDSTGDTARTGSPDIAGFAGKRDGGAQGRLVVAGNSQGADGDAIALDTTYMVLGKVEGLGGTDQVTIMVEDPDTGAMVEEDGYRYSATMWVLSEANFAALVGSGWDESVLDTERVQFATRTVETTELVSFSDQDWVQIHTRDWSTTGFSPVYDEIRFGTTLDAVSIPEPATLALMAIGATAILKRSRRRQM